MNQLPTEGDKILEQINFLTDSVYLNQKFDEIRTSPVIKDILKEIEEIENLLQITQKTVKKHLWYIRKEYEVVTRELRGTQSEIVNYLVKIKKEQIAEKENLETPLSKASALFPKSENNSHLKLPNSTIMRGTSSALKQLKFEEKTPNKTSSLSKNSNILLVFDVQITPQQFEGISKYMRGRTLLNELQHFLDNIIIQCFYEKYNLLKRTRSAVQHTKDYEMWRLYQSQISYVQGRNFITNVDISRKMERLIDKKAQNYLIMLRHLGILQEQRVSQCICYIWAAN